MRFWPLQSLSKHLGVHRNSNSQSGSSLGLAIKARVATMLVSDSNTYTNDDCDEGTQLVELNGDEPKFGNTKLENLVLLEGPP